MKREILLPTILVVAIAIIGTVVYAQKHGITSFQRQKVAMKNPNRIVEISRDKERYDAPAKVNAFFACFDINEIRGKGESGYEQILFHNEPESGFVIVRGEKFDCAKEIGSAGTVSIGTIAPGQAVGITSTLSNTGTMSVATSSEFGDYYYYDPQKDITTYELALITPYLGPRIMGQDASRFGAVENAMSAIPCSPVGWAVLRFYSYDRERIGSAMRHFKKVSCEGMVSK